MTTDATLAAYDRLAADYLEMVKDSASPGLGRFLAALPPGARVLDLGCGPGHDAERIAAAGHEVLAVDASAEMAAMAARRDGVAARQARFDDIATLGRFGGIWASFSLLHAPRADFARHLRDLHAACAPGAAFGLGMKLGEGEGTDSLGRFYTYYSEEGLRDLLALSGFTVTDAKTGENAGLAGIPEPWIVLLSHA
ncbi:methyltransferase domain-containing protein [Psychromarinibacter sp. C21-152]|uniref:Methyltransferase domain-containing protein n=1 Tax=Psychromarinibacter sediminicola TaxID=3033385 RepID=A0AAE3NPJ9_9RHOB|nr:methyltransferase domain-containing protein [Psychromarinibacter sediminicola]MDF0599309.1 methyltransferase domain-containing protein [Psychromarinibacter sediminicola]